MITNFTAAHVATTEEVYPNANPISSPIRWTAPEFLEAEETMWPTIAGDIWSLGCTCGEVKSYSLPFATVTGLPTVL